VKDRSPDNEEEEGRRTRGLRWQAVASHSAHPGARCNDAISSGVYTRAHQDRMSISSNNLLACGLHAVLMQTCSAPLHTTRSPVMLDAIALIGAAFRRSPFPTGYACRRVPLSESLRLPEELQHRTCIRSTRRESSLARPVAVLLFAPSPTRVTEPLWNFHSSNECRNPRSLSSRQLHQRLTAH
jgi:hypothetical protein